MENKMSTIEEKIRELPKELQYVSGNRTYSRKEMIEEVKLGTKAGKAIEKILR